MQWRGEFECFSYATSKNGKTQNKATHSGPHAHMTHRLVVLLCRRGASARLLAQAPDDDADEDRDCDGEKEGRLVQLPDPVAGFRV